MPPHRAARAQRKVSLVWFGVLLAAERLCAAAGDSYDGDAYNDDAAIAAKRASYVFRFVPDWMFAEQAQRRLLEFEAIQERNRNKLKRAVCKDLRGAPFLDALDELSSHWEPRRNFTSNGFSETIAGDVRVHDIGDGLYAYATLVDLRTGPESVAYLTRYGCRTGVLASLHSEKRSGDEGQGRQLRARDPDKDKPAGPSVVELLKAENVDVNGHITYVRRASATTAVVFCRDDGEILRKKTKEVAPSVESDPKLTFGVCVPPIHNLDKFNWKWIFTWAEHNARLGFSKAFLYIYEIEEDLVADLKVTSEEIYRKHGLEMNWIEIRDVPGIACSFYRGQIFAVDECLLRAKSEAIDWVLFQDLDEYLQDSGGFSADGDKNVNMLNRIVNVATASGQKEVITFGSRKVDAGKICGSDVTASTTVNTSVSELYDSIASVNIGLDKTTCKTRVVSNDNQPDWYKQVSLPSLLLPLSLLHTGP